LLLLMVLALPVGGRKLWPILASGEQSFSGTVEAMNEHTCEICKCIEVSAMVKTGGELLEVRLGPKTFLDQRKFNLSAGNSIDVTGIRFTERGKEVVLAMEVRKAGEKLILRGKTGRPAWIGEHGHICPVCGV
jgi:hypothetical protein